MIMIVYLSSKSIGFIGICVYAFSILYTGKYLRPVFIFALLPSLSVGKFKTGRIPISHIVSL